MSLDAVGAKALADEDDRAPATPAGPLQPLDVLNELRHHPWPARATFAARLARLERLLQQHFDRLPNVRFTSRVKMAVRLSLDDLALILPPTERRLLVHLRARKPLRALDGSPGFHTISRRNERLQRLLSRIQVYCGSVARHRLMQPYDRPGHEHRLRRRRKLLLRGRFRPLQLWVPRWFHRGSGAT